MLELKVKFRRIDNTVIMKVIQQDKSIRNTGLVHEHNKFMIKSNTVPQIDKYKNTILFVRGYKTEEDNRTVVEEFPTVTSAKEYIINAKRCIKSYNNKVLKDNEIQDRSTRWTPNKLESYYCGVQTSSSEKGLVSGRDIWNNDSVDILRHSKNNVFKTGEESERSLDIYFKQLELSKNFTKEEWKNNSINKYEIVFDFINEKADILDIRNKTDNVNFESVEKAREFYEFCGKDDYVKYVLGVY